MEKREADLKSIQAYLTNVDTEVTMILQQFQWDRTQLLEKPQMVSCKYNANHRIPMDKRNVHENKCFFKVNGYSKDDILLPDPADTNAGILIKLNKTDIKSIIDKAAKADPTFKRGSGCEGAEPMSLERLQASYTADERRAIYEVVVQAAPSCHDLTDLALMSGNDDEQKNAKQKSRLEILAELRDMKRRRTKYRVAAKTQNYSHLLRDVIKTQMEVYTVVKEEQAMEKQLHQFDAIKNRDNDNYKTSTKEHKNNDNVHVEISKDKVDNYRRYDHSKHGFEETHKRRDRIDKYMVKDDEYYKKQNRKSSHDRSYRVNKTHRTLDYHEYDDADYNTRKDKYKRERKNDSHYSSDYTRTDKETRKYHEEGHSSRHQFDKYKQSKKELLKYNSTGTYNRDSEHKDIKPICHKQEYDKCSENSRSSKISSYEDCKYNNESCDETKHFDRKRTGTDTQNTHKFARHSTDRKARKEDSSQHKRYYDQYK